MQCRPDASGASPKVSRPQQRTTWPTSIRARPTVGSTSRSCWLQPVSSAVSVLTDIVATYRLTKLIMEDKITEDFRNLIYEKFPKDSKLSYLIGCPWCISIWAGLTIFTLRRISPETANVVSGLLAASAITGVVYTKGLDQ